MEDATYWRDQAAKFRDSAAKADSSLERELLELAAICEQVAAELEDRCTAG